MSTQHGNGDAHAVPVGESLNIVFTRKPLTCQLVAHDVDVRMAIAVVRLALDELEAQLRLARVVEIQQQQADAALAQRLGLGK